MTCILYNPRANNGAGESEARRLTELLPGCELCYCDVTKTEIPSLLDAATADDTLILCGGDGTLFHFINHLPGTPPVCKLLYYPCGTGNDFMTDVREAEDSVFTELTPYIQALPTASVKGTSHCFLNGVGFGIDGYCCEEGDKLRAESREKINYSLIAIRGLLRDFQPRHAVVTVDGERRTYQDVWLAATMNGRYYGGGMMIAPGQNRLSEDGSVSLVVLHCPSKWKTLAVFPSLFKGEHVRHTEMVDVLCGHEIHVEFDRPTPLQIDGETVSGVREYTVLSSAAWNAGRYAGAMAQQR